MEKKSVVPIWASVVLAVLIAASLVFRVWNLITQAVGINTAINLLSILIDLYAIYYCTMDYSKSGAIFFKLYCWVNIVITALYLFLNAMTYTLRGLDAVLFLLPLLELMLYFVFAVVPDLGRKKSLTLAGILNAAVVVDMVIWMFHAPDTIMSCAEGIAVTAVFFIMVYGKYQDKAARGTN